MHRSPKPEEVEEAVDPAGVVLVGRITVPQLSRPHHQVCHKLTRHLRAGAVQGSGKAGTAAAPLLDLTMDNARAGTTTVSLLDLTLAIKRGGTPL
jgi:hypothetical protein